MRLKKLEIHGFKTFADRTVIDFSDTKGITAIVGPNGSGKSNLIDAFRWVMGEQSMKTLRGSNQEEVIFAGSEARKPLSLAEVTLTIDNTDGTLPIEYSEVQITRKYYRSGESEYLLNKQKARLKDIQGLLLDTGIGKGAYSVIGQGQVAEILHSKPEDRRSFFEEAAGINKYKNRKILSLRKLAVTEQNLTRMQDIRSEIHQQLEPLAEQAKDALEYKEYKKQLAELEIGVYKEKVSRLNNIKKEIEQTIGSYRSVVENADKKVEELVEKKQQFREKIMAIEQQIGEYRQEISEMRRQREGVQGEINIARERLKHHSERELVIDQEVAQLLANKQNLLTKQQEAELELTAAEKALQELQVRIANKGEENKGIFERWQQISREDSALREELSKLTNEIEKKKGNLLGIDSSEKYTRENIDREKETIRKLTEHLQQLESRNKEINERQAYVLEKISELKKRREALFHEKTSKEEERKKLLAEYSHTKELFDSKSSRLKLLDEMNETHEGFQKGVRSVLTARKDNIAGFTAVRGVVADLLVTPQKYEAAIEAALVNNLQAIIIEAEENVEKIITHLKEQALGRAVFLPLNSFEKNTAISSPVGEVASAVVQFDTKYAGVMNYLLGRTVIVNDLATAWAKRTEIFAAGAVQIVTLSGELLLPEGLVAGGSAHKDATSLLGRQREIIELRKDVQEYRQSLDKLNERNKEISVLFESIEQELKGFGGELNSLEVERGTLSNDLARNSIDKEKAQKDLAENEKNIIKKQEEFKVVLEQKQVVQNSLAELNAQFVELSNVIADKQEALKTVESEKERANELLTEIKISISNAEGNKRQIELKKEGLKESIAKTEAQLLQKKEEKENSFVQKQASEQLIELKNTELPAADSAIVEKENKLTELDQERKRYFNDLEVYDRLEKESNASDREARTKLSEEEIKLARVEAEYSEIEHRLSAEYELTMEDVLSSDAVIEDFEQINQEVEKLRRKIKRLEPVNLLAIEEYEAQKDRLAFIEKQCNDLLQSKDDINNLIKELDEVAIKAFKETFNDVNKHFKRIFSELFRGGEGELKIIDETNVLESGVEIYAKVPGSRRAQSMTLLSGGQKALTAIALLFSLLSARPGPFCILDEIDAALDDSNISRVTDILTKFSEETQIIIITHRQPTMAITDTMFGITMENNGISKLMSVKMNNKTKEKMLV